MFCRFCNEPVVDLFVDLVNSPPANAFLSEVQVGQPETYYPLKIYVCSRCRLVQVDEYKKAQEIFTGDYAYFSSYSRSWVEHARRYVEDMIQRFRYNRESRVVEVASNDGYLLQHFHAKGIPVLGIEPSENTAEAARRKGIPTQAEYFGAEFARKLTASQKGADLLIGNNVLAHVPNINDFVDGLKIALRPEGVITLEFPHLLRLVEECQFDTIYHEHFSYLSFTTVREIFKAHGLDLFDVQEWPTHGGSLRIFARHTEDAQQAILPSVEAMLQKEERAGMRTGEYYRGFQQRVNHARSELLGFLIDQKRSGRSVIAYGAAAKGNTMLNYAGIKGNELIEFVVDASPAKQGKFLPGSHIPVYDQARIRERKPEFVIILPWNLKQEIMEELAYVREWGGKFVVFIPRHEIL